MSWSVVGVLSWYFLIRLKEKASLSPMASCLAIRVCWWQHQSHLKQGHIHIWNLGVTDIFVLPSQSAGSGTLIPGMEWPKKPN